MTAEAMTPIVKDALGLARTWQDRANDLLTEEEKAIQAQMQRLMDHPMDKVVLTRMIDESFRPSDPARVADQVHAILPDHGIPDFFPKVERLLI
ncbi:MAG: hypothetical protein PHF66_10420, partial [Desulfobacteraceae bacterium]|nr:hypothetical protein [Desulfobacteraceae bacterium]